MLNMLTPFLGPAFEQWIEDLVFLGTRITTDEQGHEYEVEDVETLIKQCLVQPYGDAQVSINPEGIRERVEKLVILPPTAAGLVRQTDSVRDAEGLKYQIIYFRDERTHTELKIRQW
jgi:hypothetical protein